MKMEAWIFGMCSVFLLIVTPIYWISTSNSNWTTGGDWTGTSALVMTFLLSTLITFYLGFHARKITESGGRPEDRNDAEIADGAGELGFFPPYSWWPFWCGLCLAAVALGAAVGWWLFIIGVLLGAVALCGLIFEYYRGDHAH